MPHDLVVRRGLVVDGTGDAPRRGDVAIDAGTITAVGTIEDPGREELDAAGAIVTPGFIDLHTHLDAQVGWDPMLTPSSWHGVTTALLGNCGMTFAPVRPGRQRELATMMEAVEDIPAAVILDGLPWTWESYGEYLDFLETAKPAMNVAGLVGHAAVRGYVMGDDAVEGQPSADHIARQAAIVGEAVAAGAAGFSTSRYRRHFLPDGRCVPGTFAPPGELFAIADRLDDRVIFQAVLNSTAYADELDLLERIAARTGGGVLFNTAVSDDPRSGRLTRDALDAMQRRGHDVRATVATRPGGVIVGLAGLLPWHTPSWARLTTMPLSARLACLHDAVLRQSLIEEAEATKPFVAAEHIVYLGDRAPDYLAGPDRTLAALAAERGESTAATFVRLALETEGQAMFSGRFFNRSREALADLLACDYVLPGLGDAGAHVSQIMDADWTTFFLTHWIRDTATFNLADGVRRLTSVPADVLGCPDRGRLAHGAAADLNVIDLERLTPQPLEMVADLPGGAPRLLQRVEGYVATVVNGAITLRHDQPTGRRPGHVLRKFTPATGSR